MSADRWVEVSTSQFAHETDGLNVVRDILPDQSPYRAWSNFEFRDSRGNWHEVDLLLLGRDCLHLIELKYYTGRIRGNDLTWLRDGRRAEDSPLKLARRKAQYLRSRLNDEFDDWIRERKVLNAPRGRDVIPFVKESVFLHHPKVSVELAGGSPVDHYGPDGLENQTGLPGISELVLAPPGREPIGANKEQILVDLLKRIGLVQRREREAGSWILDGAAIDDGEGWQDWLATHKFSPQERRRIRFLIVQDSAPDTERRRVRQVAEHEFRVTRRLIHEHVLRPDDLVESDLGVGLVYPYDPAFQPLDLWLASRPEGVPLDTRLDIIRQAGEALAYSHGHRIVHRGLAPRAIGVKEENGRVQVQVGDWQSVGAIDSAGLTGLTGGGATQLVSVDSAATGFSAPEGALSRAVDRVRVDVFGLGALAFYILTGTPAAGSHAALRERVREQSGLDISPELPEVSSTIREAILAATRPDVSERTPDVASFLANLQEPEATPPEEIPDPLEATPGTILDDRFRVERRLGAGSTALGLLVTDLAAKGTPERVLKVALDDRAATRLADEAEVLRQLDHPRLVRLIEGPLDVGGRRTLLLSSAGRETLGRELSGRPRLSLDLLERWGIDLLEALVALDRQGITHRDIKPANLGILESRSNRQKHLVLFDFSLTKAAATATQAGTPPYLDPFLTGKRDQFDSAAERYAAAVVLFEMATGHTPVYGDGMSDPAAIRADATIELADFDPVAGPRLVPFFIRALAREAGKRHDTADEMLQEWRRCFAPDATTVPDNADQLAEAATRDTPLRASGLSPRALSALEPLQVLTVGDLLAVDPARLSVLGGAAEPTRREVRSRASQWRKRLKGTGHRGWRPVRTEGALMAPHTLADLLLAAVRGGRGTTRVDLVSRILGVTGRVDAFATHGQLGASLPKPVSTMRVHQLMPELQEAWAGDPTTREPLHQLLDAVDKRLNELGGVATVTELSAYLMTQLVPDDRSDDRTEQRLVDGLLRLALERRRALARGTDEVTDFTWRRRDARPMLVATDEALLGVAETLGQAADRLVAAVDTAGHDVLVPAGRATEALTTALDGNAVPDALREPARLARLAATTSTTAGASSVNELHHHSLRAARALALTLKTITPAQTFQPAEVRGRVAARFPALPALPTRPALDQIVEDSGLGLMFDETRRLYRAPAVGQDTTGLDTRRPTNVVPHSELLSEHGAIGQRLADSLARRSFLALGVAAAELPKAKDLLQSGYDATVIDLTETLLNAMRDLATSRGLPWATVLAADAEPQTSRGSRGLHQLIDLSLPTVEAQVSEALAHDSTSPVVLTDAALLARYGHLKMLGQWTDLSLPRGRALWLVVPQLYASQGPVIDGRSLPLAAPSQYVAVAADWIDQRRQQSSSNGAPT